MKQKKGKKMQEPLELLETGTRPILPELSPAQAPTSDPDTGNASLGQVGEDLYLIGRPELRDFLKYVRNHAVHDHDEGMLVQEWESARRIVEEIEKTEAGLPDHPQTIKLDVEGRHKPFLTEFLKDPLVRNGFNTVPTEVALVELDRLVVYQKHIDLTHVAELKAKLGPSPTEDQIFKTCLPYDHPHPPVKWSRMHGHTYVFMSRSNDIRYLGTMHLNAENIKDYPPPGSIVGVVGITIGFGSNFLNAVYCKNRLILNNGSHRAYALRDLGVTHVPCIIQHVSNMDELDVVASSDITDDSEFLLEHPRPSMLKDYFDPRLRKVMAVRREMSQIIVKFSIEEGNVPAF